MTTLPGFIDPIDAFLESAHFFWMLEEYFSTEKLFILFCWGCMTYLWWGFPIINKRFPNLDELSRISRTYFLLFTRMIIIKTMFKAALIPVYSSKITLSVDECLVIFFGALLLMVALKEPTMRDLMRKFYSDMHFGNGKFGVFFVKNDDPENPVILDDPTDTSSAAHTHSSKQPTAKDALQGP